MLGVRTWVPLRTVTVTKREKGSGEEELVARLVGTERKLGTSKVGH